MEVIEENDPKSEIIYLFDSRLSSCLLIMGRRGTGKTDMSLLIAETLYDANVMEHFSTNIKIHSSHFPIEFVSYLDDLERWCQNLKGKKMFILDEAGKSFRRRTPMSKMNIQFIDNLQILRKYKLSLVLIAPAEKYLDSVTLGSDILDAHIIKPYFNNPKIALYEDLMENKRMRFEDVPRTTVKFDTWDIAPFQKSNPDKKNDSLSEDDLNFDRWSDGTTIEELGIHRTVWKRKMQRFIKEALEMKRHTSLTKA